MTWRVALDLSDEDSDQNIIRGDIVFDFEDYLTVCTDTWYRLQQIKERTEKAKKPEEPT
jgi:hypothetical protein